MGATIILLIGVTIFMQRKIDKKELENAALYKEMNVLYDKWRVSESDRADRLMDTVNTASAVQAALVDKIELGRGQK